MKNKHQNPLKFKSLVKLARKCYNTSIIMKKEKDLGKSSAKSLLLSISIFLALIIFCFWLIFKDQNLGEVFAAIGHANFLWVLIGLLLMFAYLSVQAWNVKSVLATLNEKITFIKMLKFTFIEFFFCAITPSATGGQPLEIYYMSKEGIKSSKATLAIFVQLCGYQIAVMTLGIISVLFLPYQLPPAVFMFFTIGLLINGTALVVLLTCVFFPKVTEFVAKGFISLLKKLHFKKVDSLGEKLMSGIENYSKNAVYIKKHKKEFLKAVGRVFLQVAIYYCIPFCIYKAFGLSEHNLFELFAMQSVLFIATAGFPIPGAVGLSESVFLSLYGIAFGPEMINSAMLLSRGVTFYLFVLASAGVVIANQIHLQLAERKIAASKES